MENIMFLIGALGVLVLIVVGIVLLLYPIWFEIKFREIYNQKGISYLWAIFQVIGVFGILSYSHDTSSDGFAEALGITFIISVIAMVRNYKRVKKMGVAQSGCWLAVLAQAMAPIGILVILFVVSSILEKLNKNDKGKG